MGIINDALTGYKLGQAGKVVHGLLTTAGGMGGLDARLDTDVLIRSADRAIGAALFTGQHKEGYPHKLAVAAYALAGGLTLGDETPTLAGIYTASYAALTALFVRLGDPRHLSPYQPLNETLINSAFATLQDAKEQAEQLGKPCGRVHKRKADYKPADSLLVLGVRYAAMRCCWITARSYCAFGIWPNASIAGSKFL